MDIDAALTECNAYLGLLDRTTGGATITQSTADALDGGRSLIVDIAKAADFRITAGDLAPGRSGVGGRPNYGQVRRNVVALIGHLESRGRAHEILGPSGPQLAAERLHPWVWNAAADLWSDGHYMQAVGEAAKRIELQTQNKLGRNDVSGASLFGEAFSEQPPSPGKPRLRFADLEAGSERWKSAHIGAAHFGRGCSQGIRNWWAHDDRDVEEQQALEYLAALSVLARWVEVAHAEIATNP